MNELIRLAAARLSAAGLPSPEVDARLLLSHVLDVEPADLATVRVVSPDEQARFECLVARRCNGVPLQHLTGVAYFRYEQLRVGPGVFVPRPETECLVQLVIDWLTARAVERPVVVDLGTGSGAIALALAHETRAKVYAVEASHEAFAYAEQNLAGSGVDLRLGDWSDAFIDLDGTVDVVVSNPPYVPQASRSELPRDVADGDPDMALFAGDDDLDALRSLLPVAKRLLRPGGLLACEHDDSQGESAPELVTQAGFGAVADHKDLAGRPRFVTAVQEWIG